MMKYVIALVLGILLVPTAVYLYLRSGHAPVATSGPSLPFERFLARIAVHATIEHDLPKTNARPPTEADLVSGARIYREDCAVCHGLPSQAPTPIAKGMYPHPPQFFHSKAAQPYDSSRPLRPANPRAYWKIKNGIRLSGMPGFGDSFTERQLLQVSQFLGNARNLPSAATAALEGQSQEAQLPTPTSKLRRPVAPSHK